MLSRAPTHQDARAPPPRSVSHRSQGVGAPAMPSPRQLGGHVVPTHGGLSHSPGDAYRLLRRGWPRVKEVQQRQTPHALTCLWNLKSEMEPKLPSRSPGGCLTAREGPGGERGQDGHTPGFLAQQTSKATSPPCNVFVAVSPPWRGCEDAMSQGRGPPPIPRHSLGQWCLTEGTFPPVSEETRRAGQKGPTHPAPAPRAGLSFPSGVALGTSLSLPEPLPLA